MTLRATIFSSGANPPTGTVTFYANGTQVGTAQPVSNNLATLTYTFSTSGSYAITAIYSGRPHPSDSVAIKVSLADFRESVAVPKSNIL